MLDRSSFVEIGRDGIGNPRSVVAQSMTYFNDSLYLGVTHPQGDGPQDAARILRYDLADDEWEVVYESPLVTADVNASVHDVYRGEGSKKLGRAEAGGLVPQYRGFRSITQIADAQGNPLIFASTLSHWGSQLLVSRDGRSFEVACEPGLGNPNVLSFRAVLGFEDKLFVAPVGTVREGVMDRNFGDIARMYVSEDPLSGVWQEAAPPGFGDPTNLTVFAVAVFDDHFYAGTGNPTRGFELWKTRAQGKPPYKWKRVLTRGAYRFNVNETTAAMTVYNGALYVGSGLPGLGVDKAHDVGPAAAEMLRVWPDDSWDLLVGASRFTPEGLKVPLSLQGPGFNDPENSAMWAMTAYDGVLYVGTHHCQAFHDALAGAERIGGGFQLWATRDGEDWQAITMDGFGDPFSTGVRTLLPTPAGLFLGTSTHREIQRLWTARTRRPIQRESTGLSVWHGR
jgi:hypothetical protein